MCGFIVISDNNIISLNINKISAIFSNRGPDASGWMAFKSADKFEKGSKDKVVSASIFLAHRRLSIVDPTSNSSQPMSYENRYHIVFNGEIYNHKEIRAELEHKGYSFSSMGDTEVLLIGFVEWGHDILKKLNGMYAFVVYDSFSGTFFMARDRVGIKPLLYTVDSSGIVISSDINAIVKYKKTSLFNKSAAANYLKSGVSEHGCNSFFHEIMKAPPGHYAYISYGDKSINFKEYQAYHVKSDFHHYNFSELKEIVRNKFFESVGRHMKSDVGFGVALSGGIDSSAIACTVRKIDESIPLHAFSYIAEDNDISEEKWVDRLSDSLGLDVHKVRVSKKTFLNTLPDVIKIQAEPFVSTSIFAQHAVFASAKRHGIKVMLNGQGADELFGGYDRYQGYRLASLIKKRKFICASSFLQESSKMPGRSYKSLSKTALLRILKAKYQHVFRNFVEVRNTPSYLSKEYINDNNLNTSYSKPFCIGDNCLHEGLIQAVNGDLRSLLRYEDRNSMAFSIESRVPFLDDELASFALGLDESFLISDKGISKYIFRESMRGVVPDGILDRRDKVGFKSPEKDWIYKSDLSREAIEEAMSYDIFDKSFLGKVLNQKKEINVEECWRVINFVLWSNEYKLT